jgi:hypothetical protein
MPRDTTQFDDEAELADYLWHNYSELFSNDERLAARTLSAEWKAEHTDSVRMRAAVLKKWSARGNSNVDELLADGPDVFRRRARNGSLQSIHPEFKSIVAVFAHGLLPRQWLVSASGADMIGISSGSTHIREAKSETQR